MDQITLGILIARILLINARNLIIACDKAKADDGKITADELPGIAIETAIQSLEDLGRVDLSALMK